MNEWERFRHMVFDDPDLQRRLLAEPEVEPFLELLMAVAQERGFCFTASEARTALQEARRSWFERHVR